MTSRRSASRRPGREGAAEEPDAAAADPTPRRFDSLWWLGALLLISVGLSRGVLVSGLDHLPSPIFGGDYSYEMGCVRSIMASRNPMASTVP